MAMAAFMRARTLAPDVDPLKLIGAGGTASLATDRPKRGERRIHAAVQRADCTVVYSLPLIDDSPSRAADEEVAAGFLLWAIAESCGVDAADLEASLPLGRHEELRRCEAEAAHPELTELLLGARRRAVLRPGSSVSYFDEGEAPRIFAVFPGAFNPPHAGHLRMAAVAEARLKQPLVWELSMANVDKPPLDFISLRTRIQALRFEDHDRLIALTGAATFREKAALFSGATFVVGADTMLRIAEPRYYGGNSQLRDEAIAEIAQQDCRFLVFGREVDRQFMTLGDLKLPVELRNLCEEVPAAEFREDVSSTVLRKGPP